jgi:transcription antitermination factor NusG
MNKKWFIIEAYDGKEHDVYLRLANATLEVWRPIDVVRPSCRRSSSPTTTAVRPRRISRFGVYIFLHAVMTDSLFHAVRNTTNVKRLVCHPGTQTPCAVKDELIQFYKQSTNEKKKETSMFEAGNKVVIEQGPMKNVYATIKSVCGNRILELEFAADENNSSRIVIESNHVRLIQ